MRRWFVEVSHCFQLRGRMSQIDKSDTLHSTPEKESRLGFSWALEFGSHNHDPTRPIGTLLGLLGKNAGSRRKCHSRSDTRTHFQTRRTVGGWDKFGDGHLHHALLDRNPRAEKIISHRNQLDA